MRRAPSSSPESCTRLPAGQTYSEFINNLAGAIDGDPIVRGRMKVVVLPEYNVSLAERLIPRATSPIRSQPPVRSSERAI